MQHMGDNQFVQLLANPDDFRVKKIVTRVLGCTFQFAAQVINHLIRSFHAADPHPTCVSHYFTLYKKRWKG